MHRQPPATTQEVQDYFKQMTSVHKQYQHLDDNSLNLHSIVYDDNTHDNKKSYSSRTFHVLATPKNRSPLYRQDITPVIENFSKLFKVNKKSDDVGIKHLHCNLRLHKKRFVVHFNL